MPRTRELKTNFVNGELDPLLLGRVDVKAYFNGAARVRNAIVLPQGGARTRPGTRFLWEVPAVPAGEGGGTSNVRLVDFQFSTEQTYLFVFSHKLLTIFRENVQVAQIVMPYASYDLCAHLTAGGDMLDSGISWTQSLNDLLIFHENYAPRRVKRTGSHTSWALETYALENVPRYAFPGATYTNGVDEVQTINTPNTGTGANWQAGDTFTLLLEDEETENIGWIADRDTLKGRMQSALQRLPNAGTGVTVTYTGGSTSADTTFTVTFSGAQGGRPWGSMGYTVVAAVEAPMARILVTTPGDYPGEDSWSDARGWPRCGAIFQGRLWLAGSRSLPNSVWATRSGSFKDFNAKRSADDYGIIATSDTDDVPAFLGIYVGRHLQFFSTAAEFYVPVSDTGGITPKNFALRRTTSRGMKPGLRQVEVDGATLFVQRGGRTLREFIFADTEQAYQANNISLLASHLMRNPVGFALRKAVSTDDADYLFMPNDDGTMTLLCTLRTQEINAFALWSTAGKFMDARAVLEDVYFAVRRMVGTAERQFIEVMDYAMPFDCGTSGAAGVSTVTRSEFAGGPVEIELDGFLQPPATASGTGQVTFAHASVTGYKVGFGWPAADPARRPGLRWLLETLPVELSLPEGTTVAKRKRVSSVAVRLSDAVGLTVNDNRLSFQFFGDHLLDQPPIAFSGLRVEDGILGWDEEVAVVLGNDRQERATVIALAYDVSA